MQEDNSKRSIEEEINNIKSSIMKIEEQIDYLKTAISMFQDMLKVTDEDIAKYKQIKKFIELFNNTFSNDDSFSHGKRVFSIDTLLEEDNENKEMDDSFKGIEEFFRQAIEDMKKQRKNNKDNK